VDRITEIDSDDSDQIIKKITKPFTMSTLLEVIDTTFGEETPCRDNGRT